MKQTQKCLVRGCPNNISVKISLFRLPKEPTNLRIWLKSLDRMDLINKTSEYIWKNCRVCGAHFDSNSFTTYKRNRLTYDAVPTNFPKKQLSTDETVTVYREEEQSEDNVGSDDEDDIPLGQLEIPRKDDLASVCRGCMSSSKKQLKILLDETTMELFKQCTNLNADCDDGLPKFICHACLNSCRIWSEFQAKCKYSDSELRILYGLPVSEVKIKQKQNVYESMSAMSSVKVEVDAEPPMHMDSFVCNTCDETLYGDQYLTHVCGADKSNEEELPKYPFELHEGMSPKYDDAKLDISQQEGAKSQMELSNDSNGFDDNHADNADNDIDNDTDNADNDVDSDPDCTMDDTRDSESNESNGEIKKKTKKQKSEDVDYEEESSLLDTDEEYEYEDRANARPHNCNKCPLRFVSLRDYNRHLNFHKLVPIIKCQKCGDVFDTNCHLTKHCKKEHPGEAIANFLCTKCDRRSMTYHMLKIHMDSHDNVGIMCTVCGKMVRSKAALKSHNYRKHSAREHSFRCPECMKYFHTGSSLRKHRSCVHAEREFECNICAKSFKTPRTLRSHLLSHLDKKHCEKCDRGFKMEESLVRHMAKCNGPAKRKQKRFRPRIACGICKAYFEGVREIETHYIQAHGDQVADVRAEINKHKTKGCLECGKKFFYYVDLKIHALSHKQMECKCEHCGRLFRTATNLISHTARSHPDKLPAPQDFIDRCKHLDAWQ